MSKLFTPYGGSIVPDNQDDEGRVRMQLSEADMDKIQRGHHWSAEVTDQLTGRKFKVKGASCGEPRCFCAAELVEELVPDEDVYHNELAHELSDAVERHFIRLRRQKKLNEEQIKDIASKALNFIDAHLDDY